MSTNCPLCGAPYIADDGWLKKTEPECHSSYWTDGGDVPGFCAVNRLPFFAWQFNPNLKLRRWTQADHIEIRPEDVRYRSTLSYGKRIHTLQHLPSGIQVTADPGYATEFSEDKAKELLYADLRRKLRAQRDATTDGD